MAPEVTVRSVLKLSSWSAGDVVSTATFVYAGVQFYQVPGVEVDERGKNVLSCWGVLRIYCTRMGFVCE